LQSSSGYEARLTQAFVDIGKGIVTSEEHVDVKLLNGTLTADKLRITGGGEVVRFEGNVVMDLIMDNPTPAGESGLSANASVPPDPAPSGKARSSGKSTNPK
jgi:lipopolysaccharide export system protein LptC